MKHRIETAALTLLALVGFAGAAALVVSGGFLLGMWLAFR